MKFFVATLVIFFASAISQESFAQIAQPSEVTSFNELKAALTRIGINHQANDEQLFALVAVQNKEFKAAQVIRWAQPDGVVHFIQVIPVKVPEEQISNVEAAIVRLNHSYPIPGLGMNHQTQTLYFRMTVPLLPRGHILDTEIRDYFGYCVNQAIQLEPTMTALSEGKVTSENAMDYHRKQVQASLGPIGGWKKSALGSEWSLIIKPNGEVTLRKDGEVVVDSMVTIEGQNMTFDDVNGTLAADENGTYSFAIQDGQLTFTLVEDPSEGRQKILTGAPWTR